MSEPIVVIDVSKVLPGKLEDVKLAFKDLADFVEQNEERPIVYSVYFSEEESEVTVLQVHPDSASMETHLEIAGSKFGRFAELLRLLAIDIYGNPSDKVLQQMKAKANLLGGAILTIHNLHAGFARSGR